MAIRGSSPAARTFECARNFERCAGATWGTGLVTFDLADAARVARLAKAVGPLLVLGNLLLMRCQLRRLLLLLLVVDLCVIALVTEGMSGLVCLLLQDFAEALDLGI
jgi:hypothetical protein